MALSWFFKSNKNDNKQLGETLASTDNIKAEIANMQGSIVKTSKAYRDNIKKYKDIAKFNQHLTKSYVNNMKVMVDVSELLNSYASVFNALRDEFGKMEAAVGKSLNLTDFEYLENLTQAKIENLNAEFQKQANGIKKLYAEYGKPDELNRILLAQGDVQRVIENASDTYASLGTVPIASPLSGGKSKSKSKSTRKSESSKAQKKKNKD